MRNRQGMSAGYFSSMDVVLIILSQYEIQKEKMRNGGLARRPFTPSATYATQLHLPLSFLKMKVEEDLEEFEEVLDDLKKAKIIVEQEQEIVKDDNATYQAVELSDSDGDEDKTSYEVSSKAGHRTNNDFVEYTVLWKNYPKSEATVSLPHLLLAF